MTVEQIIESYLRVNGYDGLQKQAELLKEVAASLQRIADFLDNTRHMIIVGKREEGRNS